MEEQCEIYGHDFSLLTLPRDTKFFDSYQVLWKQCCNCMLTDPEGKVLDKENEIQIQVD